MQLLKRLYNLFIVFPLWAVWVAVLLIPVTFIYFITHIFLYLKGDEDSFVKSVDLTTDIFSVPLKLEL